MQRLSFCSLLIKFLLVFSASFISTTYAAELDLLNDIGSQIGQHHVVRADFIQTKQMAALKRPLITRGKLVYSREYGVLWQIEQPYRISYILGEDKIIEIDATGNRKVRGLRDVPGLAQVGRVFRAMLGANTTALKGYFDIAVAGEPSKWVIQLTPNQTQLMQFLTQLKLNGGKFVEGIEINEANGDQTLIRFTNSQSASALDDAELKVLTGSATKS